MKKIIVIISMIILLSGCNKMKLTKTNDENMISGKLTMSGSTTVLPIAQICAEEFMNNYPNVNISVRGGGSSIGIKDIMSGTVQIGNASRDAKSKEIAKAKNAGINLHKTIVAYDGIAVIVHPNNKISNLSRKQLEDIYTGKITNWKELGGDDKKIVVISRDTSSGTYEVFYKKALQKKAVIPSASMVPSNNAAVTNVATTPGAISYCGLGYLNSKVKPIKVENVDITIANVKSGKYLISRSLNMYTKGIPTGLPKMYLDFVTSEIGQKLVSEQGFITIK